MLLTMSSRATSATTCPTSFVPITSTTGFVVVVLLRLMAVVLPLAPAFPGQLWRP